MFELKNNFESDRIFRIGLNYEFVYNKKTVAILLNGLLLKLLYLSITNKRFNLNLIFIKDYDIQVQ